MQSPHINNIFKDISILADRCKRLIHGIILDIIKVQVTPSLLQISMHASLINV